MGVEPAGGFAGLGVGTLLGPEGSAAAGRQVGIVGERNTSSAFPDRPSPLVAVAGVGRDLVKWIVDASI